MQPKPRTFTGGFVKHSKLAYRTHAYVSDFERFLGQYMTDHPTVAAGQQRGWRLWWDRHVDLMDLAVHPDDAVAVKAHQYD